MVFRKSLKILREYQKEIKTKSISSGTRVFDWKVPDEWHFRKLYISYKGKKLIDKLKTVISAIF